MADPMMADDDALAECVGGHLEVAGPVTVEQLVADATRCPPGSVRGAPVTAARARTGLARLEAAGSAIELPDGRWCARHLLVRLHAASRSRRRRQVEPASIADFVRFLACWQHVAAGTQAEGRAGLLAVIEQLQGLEVAAGEWERARAPGPGRRLRPPLARRAVPGRRGGLGPADPTARARDPTAGPGSERPGIDGRAVHGPPGLVDAVTGHAAGHRRPPGPGLDAGRGPGRPGPDRARRPGPRPTSWPPSAAGRLLPFRAGARPRDAWTPRSTRGSGTWWPAGIVTADAFSAVRSLLSARQRHRSARRPRGRPTGALGRQRSSVGTGVGEGRWSLLPEADGTRHRPPSAGPPAEELAEAVAWQLLARWGVVAWELWARESYRIPWRDVVRALRRLEARGQALGGRFVAGISGEQYASPEAVAAPGQVRGDPGRGDEVVVAGADPLNLTGAWLGGTRVPAVRHRSVHYQDGVPADLVDPAPSSR